MTLALLGLQALLIALCAGLFLGWSIIVMPGFSAGPPSVWIAAMNAINPAVRNAAFAVVFFGPVLLGLACAWVVRGTPALPWVAGAWLLHAAGVVGATMLLDVPINEAMASWDAANPPADWRAVQDRWTTYNHLRTAAGIVATLAMMVAFRRAG
jgi:uncharacterized membrane protein